MVKEFKIVLTSPSQSTFAPNSDVPGYVHVVTEEDKTGYESIGIILKGYSEVKWGESRGTGVRERTVVYQSYEVYINQGVVLWSKETAPGNQLAAGFYQFPFSLKIPERPAHGFPSPFQGEFGRVVYELEAVIVKTSALRFNKKSTLELPFSPVVDPNFVIPNVLEPKILQVQKTLCCLCCKSGPISLTVRMPRTGFCIGVDTIPFEADVENGSNRQIGHLEAKLIKIAICTAQGRTKYEHHTLESVKSDPIEPGSSFSWKPPPLDIPQTEPTISSSKVIQLSYTLRVQAVVSGSFNPIVGFVLFLGNVPVNDAGLTSSSVPPGSIAPTSFDQQQPPAVGGDAILPSSTPPPSYTPPPRSTPPPPAVYFQPVAPSVTGLPPGFVDPIKR